MKYYILSKHGKLAPIFREDQLEIAKMFAEMKHAKVIEIESNAIIADYCKEKHFREKK